MNTPEPPVVGGRYQLGELLGRGGMAEVRKGTDTRLGRVVAVKRLRTDLASDATFQARFRREAQSAASLNHPAIVAVYDTGEAAMPSGPLPYIVMEYVDGVTLRDIVHTDGPMPPSTTGGPARAMAAVPSARVENSASIVWKEAAPSAVPSTAEMSTPITSGFSLRVTSHAAAKARINSANCDHAAGLVIQSRATAQPSSA